MLTQADLVLLLSAQDGNTVLHLAAWAGLSRCVDLLVEWNADLSVTNKHNQTPADVATEANHTDIATKLETKILFQVSQPLMAWPRPLHTHSPLPPPQQNDKPVSSIEPDPAHYTHTHHAPPPPQNDKPISSIEPDADLLHEIANGPMGMKDHDIRSMKDELLIETSHMLGVSLFTAEVLLRNNSMWVWVGVYRLGFAK